MQVGNLINWSTCLCLCILFVRFFCESFLVILLRKSNYSWMAFNTFHVNWSCYHTLHVRVYVSFLRGSFVNHSWWYCLGDLTTCERLLIKSLWWRASRKYPICMFHLLVWSSLYIGFMDYVRDLLTHIILSCDLAWGNTIR